MAEALQHCQTALIARISTTGATDDEPVPDTARSGRANAIISPSRWYKKSVRSPVIPNRSNATKKAYCPKRFYRRRYKIENFFCRIKDWRRIATRYDKLARNFLAAANLVGALYWIKL